jgi:transposase
MFIKGINKKNTPQGKTFRYYQLTEAYRVGGSIKQRATLYLGRHEILDDKKKRQAVASLLEAKIRGKEELSSEFLKAPKALLRLVEELYLKYLQKYKSDEEKEEDRIADDARYDSVDMTTTKVYNVREIGAEAISLEILDRVGLGEFLQRKGWKRQDTDNALISLVSRAVFASSERKTEDWLRQNSGLMELFGAGTETPNRYHLYKAAAMLYEIREELEEFFYSRFSDMFDFRDKLIIYDLTNTYFEGRKERSKIAKFGRSKEKRNDCRQAVLAAVINEQGFLKHSRIYEGNMADPSTFAGLLDELEKHTQSPNPIIVMDAGISDEKNLTLAREKKYEYVCVSRSKPRSEDKPQAGAPIEIEDKRRGKIELRFMDMQTRPDTWLQVKSRGKKKKEDSMMGRAFEKFELELSNADKATRAKSGTKKIDKVWERIGRIKERNKSANKYYEINAETEGGFVTSIKWRRKDPESGKNNGIYYLRTNCKMQNEKQVWDIYNTVREVESAFRCLKTDLNLRPVFHQKDVNVEAHLHLGLMAYNIVAPIRHTLKQRGVNSDWRNIVRTMNTQKVSSVSVIAKNNSEIIIRTCSRPSAEALEIYKALGMTSMPVGQKKFVVTHQKKTPP